MLLANIAILAHVAVPHHHHNGALAFVLNSIGGEPSSAHGHFHDDSRPHGSDSGRCVADETLVAAVSRLQKGGAAAADAHGFDIPLLLFAVVAAGTSLSGLAVEGVPFAQGPHVECCHMGRPGLSFGLRAPPFC